MGRWALAEEYVTAHADEAVAQLEQLSPDDVKAFLEEGSAPAARAALERIDAVSGAAALRRCSSERAGELVGALPPRVALRLLRYLGASDRARVLEAVPEARADELRRGLAYPADCAGGLMDPAVLSLPEELSVQEARKRVRRHAALAADDLWVTARSGELVGAVRLRELVLSDGRRPLRELVDTHVGRIAAGAGRAAVAAHPSWQSRSALPVVDASGRLLGVIPARALVEMRQPAPPAAGTGPVAAGLAIGELYWLTAARLMGTLLGASEREPR